MSEQSSLSEPEAVTHLTESPGSAVRFVRPDGVRTPHTRTAPHSSVECGAAGGGGCQRAERLTAETTAFSEARVVLASMPMPHRTLPSMAHSMYEAACAEAPSLIVCSW